MNEDIEAIAERGLSWLDRAAVCAALAMAFGVLLAWLLDSTVSP